MHSYTPFMASLYVSTGPYVIQLIKMEKLMNPNSFPDTVCQGKFSSFSSIPMVENRITVYIL